MGTDKHVVIAGAGPAGCSAAMILARADISVTLLEAQGQLPTDLRASTFHPPTLDMLAELGLADILVAQGLKAPSYQFRDRRSGDFATFDMACLNGLTGFPYRLQCEQFKLTRAAVAALADYPHVDIRFGRAVRGLTQDGDGIVALTDGPDGPERHEGAYLIGADGASSAVRQALDIGFEGFTYPEQWIVVSTDHDLSAHFENLSNVAYVADPDEWFTLLKVPGVWRVLLPERPEVTEAEALADARLEERLQGIAPKQGPYAIKHRTLYRIHQRVADTYRVGRAVLAGDAAHINNPLGGMGMNGGVQDAINLARKLVRILNDGADADRMLDHYSAQRKAIAVEYVQAHTHANKKMIEERDPAARAARMADMKAIAADPDRLLAHARKGAMIDAVAKSMAVDPV